MLCLIKSRIASYCGEMRPPRKATTRTLRFGRHLAELRQKAGLTQAVLAEKAGISARYVQDLEAGLYSPTIWICDALRKALKVSWMEVLKAIGKPDPEEDAPPAATREASFPMMSAQPAFMPKGKPGDRDEAKAKKGKK